MCRTLLPNENGYEFSERESFPHCGCAGMWRLLILILGICEGAKLIVWPAAWRPEPPTGQWTTRAFLDMSASRNTVIPETRCSVFWGLHQSQAKIYKMSVADCRLKCPGVTWATILISRFIKCNFLLPLQVIFYLVRKRQEKKKKLNRPSLELLICLPSSSPLFSCCCPPPGLTGMCAEWKCERPFVLAGSK